VHFMLSGIEKWYSKSAMDLLPPSMNRRRVSLGNFVCNDLIKEEEKSEDADEKCCEYLEKRNAETGSVRN